MAYRIYFSRFERTGALVRVTFILSDWREYEPLEELDLELLRGR